MVSTHVLAPRDAEGRLTFAQGLAGGRSAALFAVLAGVGLALMTGRQEPVRGRERLARSAGITARALIISAIGLLLGALHSGLAVILTYYGLLFLVGLLFIGLRARGLFLLGALWLVVAPVVSHVLRPHLPPFDYGSPDLHDLSTPSALLSQLAFTGYYPVVPWVAYLLVGMGLGRLDLTMRRNQVWIAAAGGVIAVVATTASHALTAQDSVLDALVSSGAVNAETGAELLDEIAGGMHGTTPASAWQWLLVVAPHSSTPFDLAQTIGSSLLVIGSCLGLVGLLGPGGTRIVAVVFGAGTMTLSLYTLHVILRTPAFPPPDAPSGYPWHVAVLMGIGALFVLARRRGPLESLVAMAAARVAALVRRR